MQALFNIDINFFGTHSLALGSGLIIDAQAGNMHLGILSFLIDKPCILNIKLLHRSSDPLVDGDERISIDGAVNLALQKISKPQLHLIDKKYQQAWRCPLYCNSKIIKYPGKKLELQSRQKPILPDQFLAAGTCYYRPHDTKISGNRG